MPEPRPTILVHLRRMWLAYLLLASCLLALAWFSQYLRKTLQHQRRQEFVAACDAIRDRAEIQFTYQLALLMGMRGILAARTNVTADEFRRCLASLDVATGTEGAPRSTPGLRDLGFVMRVPKEGLKAHVDRMHASGFYEYEPVLSTAAQEHFPVVYLDDFMQGGVKISGWDLAQDETRLKTLLRARDTGNPMATPPLVLHSRTPDKPRTGFVLYLPVYEGGTTPATEAERRQRLVGFTFASFEHRTLWAAIESPDNRTAHLFVFNGSNFTAKNRLYPPEGSPQIDRPAEFIHGFNMDGLGLTWGLFFATRPEFQGRPGNYVPITVEVLGGLVSLGLFSIAWVLTRGRWEAERMARELKSSEAKFRRIFESIQDVYYQANLQGIIELASPSCRNLLGYEPSEIEGRSVLEAYADPAAREETMKRILTEGQISDYELVLLRKDGRPIHVSLTGQVLRDDQGRTIGSEGTLRDITARKEAEAEHFRASKLESVGLLAGGIAHDFNNILGAILGNIGLLRLETYFEPETEDCLLEIENATLRARDLTQQLLTFAKGGEPIRKAASLEEIIRDTVSFTLRGSSIRHRLDLDQNLWPAEVDTPQLHRVLQNICLNAVQAMPKGGSLTVSAKNVTRTAADDSVGLPQGPYLHITLTDSGPGIAPENLPRIFDPYFTTKEKGNGLGLATAYSIIRRHEGRLTAESREGKGTSFHIWLPASPAALIAPPAETSPVVSGSGHILVVDDEAPLRAVLSRFLTQLGYQVTAAASGEEALEILRTHRNDSGTSFKAAILDLTIPGAMGGKELLPHLQALQPDLKTIVSSGYSSDPVMASYRQHGFDGVLAKPFLPAEIASLLNSILRERNPDSSKSPNRLGDRGK